jgi:hypothetical protein
LQGAKAVVSGVSVTVRARQVHRFPPDKDNACVFIVTYLLRARQVHRLPPDKGNTLDDVVHALVVGLAPVIVDSRGVVSDLPCTAQSMDQSLALLVPNRFAAHPDAIANDLDFEIIVLASSSCGMQSVVHPQQDHTGHLFCSDCHAAWDCIDLPDSHGHGTWAEYAQFIYSTPIAPIPVQLMSHISLREMQFSASSAIADVWICHSSLKKPMMFVLQFRHDLGPVNGYFENRVSSTQQSYDNGFECCDAVIVEASSVVDYLSSMAQKVMRSTLYPTDSSDSSLAQLYVYRCVWSGILVQSYTHSGNVAKHATALFILDTSHLIGMEPPWTLCGILINGLHALFFHGISDSAIEDLYLPEAAHNLFRRDDDPVAEYQPNSWKWKGEIALFYATVNEVVYIDMGRVLETGDAARSTITSHLVADIVAEWVHCSRQFSQLWSPEMIPFGCFGCPPEVKLHNSGAGFTNVGSSTNEVDNDFSALSLSAPDMNSCLALNTFPVRKSFASAWSLLQPPALPQAVCLLVALTTFVLRRSSMAQWFLTCRQCIACLIDNCGLSTLVLTLVMVMALYQIAILCCAKPQSPDQSVLKAIGISRVRISNHRSSPPLQDKSKMSRCFLILPYVMLHCNAVRCHLQTIVDAVIDALNFAHHRGRVLVFEHSRQVPLGWH